MSIRGNYRLDRGDLQALIAQCRERGVALRVGVNHGSLAKRVFDEWGDTPQGMVVSAMEFLRVCRECDFDQVVVSMKSSNTRVMVAAYRLLVEAMDAEDMHYPIHLGVTEAGNGIEGRVKKAPWASGALLADGIGDTIRVSLTEAPENEIPVAQLLVEHFADRPGEFEVLHPERYSPTEYRRRSKVTVPVSAPSRWRVSGCSKPPFRATDGRVARRDPESRCPRRTGGRETPLRRAFAGAHARREKAADLGPLLLSTAWPTASGSTLRDLPKRNPRHRADDPASCARAFSHTEYIACPSCGRSTISKRPSPTSRPRIVAPEKPPASA